MVTPIPHGHASDDDFGYRVAAEETWRIFRIMAEFVESIEVMAHVGPAVSIFGSARTPPDNPFYERAAECARLLADSRPRGRPSLPRLPRRSGCLGR